MILNCYMIIVRKKSSLLHVRVFYHMRVLALFVKDFLPHLVEPVYYRLATTNGQSYALLDVSLQALYTATMIGGNGLFCIQ